MKIRCVYNNPESLPDNILSGFNHGLELNKEYLVMGIVLADKKNWYLIDANTRPSLFPSDIFEITDHSLSLNWFFSPIYTEDYVYPLNKNGVLGYYEFVLKKDHYEKLVDRDEEAMQIYFKRKIELENLSANTI